MTSQDAAPRGANHVLDVRGLKTHYFAQEGVVRAIDGIDLAIERGSTVCVVGESGSGKTAAARSVLQLVDKPGRIVSGQILYDPASGEAPIDLAALGPKSPQMRAIRGEHIAMIFQEPMSSLSPVHTIGRQIIEMLRLHEDVSKDEARDRAIEELRGVGIPSPEKRIDDYTFQLSGGLRQRGMIAMALICRPRILIADEPTTALDVTTQAQILDLLADLKARLGMTLILVTHDLGVVAEVADHVAVMRSGRIVEQNNVDAIFHAPSHPYTQSLLADLPQRRAPKSVARDAGEQPSAGPGSSHSVQPGDSGSQLLEIDSLVMHFQPRRHRQDVIKAVDGVSLQVRTGETFGLVGESGCGKTTLGRCILGAYQPSMGTITYSRTNGDQVDLTTLDTTARRPYRGEIRMIFQDPYGSLNPRMTVRQIIGEPLLANNLATKKEINDRVHDLLELVGLSAGYANRYPHAFSGGERQRIGIARALITNPRLVVADEAVSALDVSVRSQIIELLTHLQQELQLTYIFISHDLSVVQSICDRVAVMYFGRIVEEADVHAIYHSPQHPYTQALLSAVPIPDPRLRGTRQRHTYRPDRHDVEPAPAPANGNGRETLRGGDQPH